MDNEPHENFSYEDALILYSISEKCGGTMVDILSREDCADHSTSTYKNMDMALRRFIALGLVVKKGNRYYTTERVGRDFKQQPTIVEEVKQLQHNLNARISSSELASLVLPDHVITASEFACAQKQYMWHSIPMIAGVVAVVVALMVGFIYLTYLFPIEIFALTLIGILLALLLNRLISRHTRSR